MNIESPYESEYLFEEEIINYPSQVYARLKSRLTKEGPLAPMPEFESIVQELLTNLEHPFIQDLIEYDRNSNSPLSGSLASQYNQAVIYLRHVALKVELSQEEIDDDYPHRPLSKDRYPYQPTLEAISKALDFFDVVARIAHKNNIPLYHSDRYTHYELSLKYIEDIIMIPSSKPLTLEDLIRLRAYPLAMTGVSHRALFADAYNNTPKDFWVHDVNHNRRFASYNNKYCEKYNCTKEAAFKQFERTINEIILPSIKINLMMSKEEIHLRQIMKAIYFEFLHEYAFTPDVDSLKAAFLFRAGDPAPFEIMFIGNENRQVDPRKTRRMPNNNLISGVLGYAGQSGKQTTTVKYIHDEVGPNFITSLFNKLTHSFYDCKYYSTDELPPLEERTPELVADAALKVMEAFAINPQELGLNREKLILLAKNQDVYGKMLGGVEKYPHNELKKLELKKDLVEKAILPLREAEFQASNSTLITLKDDTTLLTRRKTDLTNYFYDDMALSSNRNNFFMSFYKDKYKELACSKENNNANIIELR